MPQINSTDTSLTFGRFLKFWRGVHGLSQEQLAAIINSSPRHISRLENGSSRPSQGLANDIAKAMKLGQRDTNHLLIAAGFLPSTGELDFHAPELKWLRKTMTLSLKALDPYPAIVMNDASDILMVNRGWVGLFNQTINKTVLDSVTNNFEFLFNRHYAGNLISGWEDTLSVILMGLEQGALFSDRSRDYKMVERLAKHENVPDDWRQRAATLEPMPSFRIQVNLRGDLQKFFSVHSTISTVGPAALLSGPSININTLYPEDEDLDLSQFCTSDLSHPLLYY
ncbi:MAG: helix-turn-helix domain-containing protein [Porticoccaceae bacterium]|nr:helix-turn-helix domain-containing protein [Porticoccaceae bacterium]MDG1306835.1 helix-turn-helix domain-containing protein [Porticoccaceae bacterium]